MSSSNFRNLQLLELNFSPDINLVTGPNGSGKTSILEAISVLSNGKSFRTSRIDPLICYEAKQFVLFAELESGQRIGLQRPRTGAHSLRLQGENQKSWESVARALPTQVLDSGSFGLLEGGPKARRAFLDWGVFHVKHGFVVDWRRARKCISQRNHLLKAESSRYSDLAGWDAELSVAATAVDEARTEYIDRFEPVFREVVAQFSGELAAQLSVHYDRGWDSEKNLADVLEMGYETDRRYGATQHGPHRADLLVKANSRRAVEVLSRGQQKLVISALKIAQGKLFSEFSAKGCIYLVDDLPAELDARNRGRVLDVLASINCQLVISSIEPETLTGCFSGASNVGRFHVEHGIISG